MHHRPPMTALAALSALGLAGCVAPRSASGPSLRPADFIANAEHPGDEPVTPKRDSALAARAPTDRTGPVAASEGIFDITGVVGSPTPAVSAPAPAPPLANATTPRAELIDGIVGYVNNRAIYISDFLAPMEARLKAESTKVPRDQWIQFAAEQIGRELNALVEDELLEAEARATLTPEQKQGLFEWVRRQQADLISRNYGSRELAAERLANKEGFTPEDAALAQAAGTLDEWTRAKEQRELVAYQLSRQIYRRLSVSWRDIELGYERDYETFNPPPTAHFRLIRVALRNQDAADRVTLALAAGTDFAAVAATPDNDYNPEEAGLYSSAVKGAYETTQFFQLPALNENAHTLQPGRWTGPFEAAGSHTWLFLDRIDRRSMDLYDAQLKIQDKLFVDRATEARQRYVNRLKQRASFTSIEDMGQRLLAIAIERYAPPERRN